MGARMPEAPTICLQATTIFNKEPALVPKTYDFYGNGLYTYFQWRSNRIPCSFSTFETQA